MIERGKTTRLLSVSLIAVLFILFVWFALPPLIVLVLPFVFAFIIAKLIEPVVQFMHTKLRINKNVSSAVTVLVVVGLLIWFITAVVFRVVEEVSALVSNAEKIAAQVTESIRSLDVFLSDRFGDETMAIFYESLDVSHIGTTVSEYLTGKIGPLISRVYSAAKSVPNILIFTVVLILGTYFMSSDSEKIREKTNSLLPKIVSKYTSVVKSGMTHALLGYIRAQCILIGITFVELLVGFSLLGGNIAAYALILAFCISIIDAFPILGTGTVLIPWSLYELLTGNYLLAVYLVIIYIVCLFVRQMLEPRIVGKQIGLHPLATLMTMYAGLKIMGIFGMILGPVLTLIIKNLSDAGVFRSIGNYIRNGTADEKQ